MLQRVAENGVADADVVDDAQEILRLKGLFLASAYAAPLSIAPCERMHSLNRARSHEQMQWHTFVAKFVNHDRKALARALHVPEPQRVALQADPAGA